MLILNMIGIMFWVIVINDTIDERIKKHDKEKEVNKS